MGLMKGVNAKVISVSSADMMMYVCNWSDLLISIYSNIAVFYSIFGIFQYLTVFSIFVSI